jgi:hypothetical protein
MISPAQDWLGGERHVASQRPTARGVCCGGRSGRAALPKDFHRLNLTDRRTGCSSSARRSGEGFEQTNHHPQLTIPSPLIANQKSPFLHRHVSPCVAEPRQDHETCRLLLSGKGGVLSYNGIDKRSASLLYCVLSVPLQFALHLAYPFYCRDTPSLFVRCTSTYKRNESKTNFIFILTQGTLHAAYHRPRRPSARGGQYNV